MRTCDFALILPRCSSSTRPPAFKTGDHEDPTIKCCWEEKKRDSHILPATSVFSALACPPKRIGKRPKHFRAHSSLLSSDGAGIIMMLINAFSLLVTAFLSLTHIRCCTHSLPCPVDVSTLLTLRTLASDVIRGDSMLHDCDRKDDGEKKLAEGCS